MKNKYYVLIVAIVVSIILTFLAKKEALIKEPISEAEMKKTLCSKDFKSMKEPELSEATLACLKSGSLHKTKNPKHW